MARGKELFGVPVNVFVTWVWRHTDMWSGPAVRWFIDVDEGDKAITANSGVDVVMKIIRQHSGSCHVLKASIGMHVSSLLSHYHDL